MEIGSFTPLAFGTNGGMGKECRFFLSNVAYKYGESYGESYARVISWLRTRISSRTPFRQSVDLLDKLYF